MATNQHICGNSFNGDAIDQLKKNVNIFSPTGIAQIAVHCTEKQ